MSEKNEEDLEILASGRFVNSYRSASPSLQNCAERAIRNFRNWYVFDKRTLLKKKPYQKVRGLKGERVLEIDISPGDRLLAIYESGCLKMLDMGKHEIVGQYTANMVATDKRTLEPAPDQFLNIEPSRIFIDGPDFLVTPKYQE